MTKREFTILLRKYRMLIAALAFVVLSVVSLGAIWYMQSAGPIAPTAPTSRPRAAQNICSLEFEIPMACLSITANGTVQSGSGVTFRCEGLAGADRYIFSYRSGAGEQWTVFADGTSNTSPELVLGDYADVRCVPCAGDYCAEESSLPATCSINYIAPTPVPTPSPTPTPTPVATPSPTPTPVPTPSPSPVPTPSPVPQCNSACTQNSQCPGSMVCSNGYCRNPQCTESASCTCGAKAAFVIEKFNDLDGDATRDSNEGGLSWAFEWQLNSDGNWRTYQTYSNQGGRGGTIGDLKTGDVVTVREEMKDGWQATTATEQSVSLVEGQTQRISFGNRQLSAPVPSPTPVVEEELPEAGSWGQTFAMMTIGAGVLLLGGARWHLLHKKR